jgi:hypothetical protein
MKYKKKSFSRRRRRELSDTGEISKLIGKLTDDRKRIHLNISPSEEYQESAIYSHFK